jgi:hypothetical protein
MLPLYTEKPYPPQETQDLFVNLLIVVTTPYKAYAPIFHVLTILIISLIVWKPAKMGRVLSGYGDPLGKYLVNSALQIIGLDANVQVIRSMAIRCLSL